MDIEISEVQRGLAIDNARQDILSETTLTFLPCRQTQFLKDYSNLPGEGWMPVMDRIKLIPDDYRRKFLKRVEIVTLHSRQTDIERFSEFNWEADAWRDIFGRLRDDERLLMDKREYNFKATVLDPLNTRNGKNAYMGKRIPDITCGLSTYILSDPNDEGVDGRERRMRKALHRDSLRHYICTLNGNSLIADGKWGECTIIFPFAVYEAKKDQNSKVGVTVQLKLAFNTYLKMLDRLVCQPGKMEEYQSSKSIAFPIFGFTSNGCDWRMYVGYLPNCMKEDAIMDDDPLCDENSHMKLIWWGNISDRQHAGELLDMVDQIHEYAVTTHRLFVVRHLEAWKRFNTIHKNPRHCRVPELPILPTNSDQESELDWYSIKFNSKSIQKLLKEKRRQNILLTDDDVKRATLEARLKEWERNRSSPSWDNIRRRRNSRKLPAGRARQQPQRKSKTNLRHRVYSS